MPLGCSQQPWCRTWAARPPVAPPPGGASDRKAIQYDMVHSNNNWRHKGHRARSPAGRSCCGRR
eukprot:7387773-Prymnesium_polylepis.1